jgi:hypothetical protein
MVWHILWSSPLSRLSLPHVIEEQYFLLYSSEGTTDAVLRMESLLVGTTYLHVSKMSISILILCVRMRVMYFIHILSSPRSYCLLDESKSDTRELWASDIKQGHKRYIKYCQANSRINVEFATELYINICECWSLLTSTMMMEAETVSETLVFNSKLKWLIALGDFIALIRGESIIF